MTGLGGGNNFPIDVTLDGRQVEQQTRRIGRNLERLERQAARIDRALPSRDARGRFTSVARSVQQVETATRSASREFDRLGRTLPGRDAQGRFTALAGAARQTQRAVEGIGRSGQRLEASLPPRGVFGRLRQLLRGTRDVERSLERVERRSRGIGVGGLFGGFAALRAIQGIGRTADSFTDLQSRLRTVTDSEEQLLAVQNELNEVANETRTAVGTNAEFFQRLAGATQGQGRSAQELLDVTRSLNQAVRLSGVTAIEAENAIRQLSQGIGSGELRGQELRSVLEQLPFVADVIATELGITRGELLKFGEAGRITGEVVLEAFKNSREEIEERFKAATITVGQSMTVLGNRFLDFVGQVDQATGASRNFSRFILNLGEAIGGIPTAAGIALQRVAPIVDTIVGFFRGSFNVIGVLFDALPDRAGDAGQVILRAFRDSAEGIVDFFGAALQTIGNTLRALGQNAVSVVANVGGAIGAASRGNVAAAQAFADNIESAAVRSTAVLSDIPTAFAQNLRRLQGVELLPEVELTDGARQLGDEASRAFQEGFNAAPATELANSILAGIDEFTSRNQGNSGLLDEVLGGENTQELSRQARAALEDLNAPAAELAQRMSILDELFRAGAISAETFGAESDAALLQSLQGANALGDGFQRAFALIRQEARDFASVAEASVGAFVDTSSAALLEFVQTGRANIKEFANDFIQEIQRILVRLLVVQSISALTGGGGALGGLLGGAIGGRQFGGRVSRGQPVVVGERRPEVFVPDSNGTVQPSVAAATQQQAEPQSIEIENRFVLDPQLVLDILDSPAGGNVIMRQAGRNPQRLRNTR